MEGKEIGMTNKKKKTVTYIVMLALGFIFFFLLGDRGVILEKDSHFYFEYQKSKMLSPVYATFIYICQVLIDNYLGLIIMIQGALAILCCMYLTKCIQKEFGLDNKWAMLVYVLSFVPYAYSLPEYVSTHLVTTEGLTFSIFYLWFVCVLRGVLHADIKRCLFSNVWAAILMLTRFQLGLLFGINVLVLGYVVYQISKDKKKFFQRAFVLGIGIVFAVFLFLKTDTGFVFMDHVANLSFGKVFYVADEEDVELYEDEECRKIFNMIVEAIDGEKLRFEYARSGFEQWIDLKQTSLVQVEGNSILREHVGDVVKIREVRQNLIIPLLIDNLGKYILVNLLLYPESLMCALFVRKESIYLLCYLMTFFLFGSAIGICFLGKKRMRRESHLYMALVLLILVVNIVLINLVLYGLQRYLVYTQGLFYIGYFLMLKDLINKKGN